MAEATGPRMMAAVRILVVCVALVGWLSGALSGCHSTPRPTKPPAAVVGLARDSHTGEPVGMAEIELRGPTRRTTSTNKYGLYTIDGLAAGTYSLHGVFAGQPIDIAKIPVRDGEATYVDLMFTLGDPQPINVVFGDHSAEITRYQPKTIAPGVAIIEGTLSDVSTRERVVGAVVTAIGNGTTEQTITDDHGRYRFDNVAPGTYTVSAYYSIGGRAQVEMQRNGVELRAGEAAVVPLVIELNR